MPTANSRFMPFAVPLLSCRVTLPLLPYRAVLPHCTASAVLYRTYVFNKLLPQPSELLTVTLPRPLGVVFEYDARFKRAVVVDVVEGSAAAQRQRVAGLNPRLAKETVQPGGWVGWGFGWVGWEER